MCLVPKFVDTEISLHAPLGELIPNQDKPISESLMCCSDACIDLVGKIKVMALFFLLGYKNEIGKINLCFKKNIIKINI